MAWSLLVPLIRNDETNHNRDMGLSENGVYPPNGNFDTGNDDLSVDCGVSNFQTNPYGCLFGMRELKFCCHASFMLIFSVVSLKLNNSGLFGALGTGAAREFHKQLEFSGGPMLFLQQMGTVSRLNMQLCETPIWWP